MEYSEKFKDPRWQKKRLHILDRDKFIYQWCHDANTTLHVHHIMYLNRDPWDYPDTMLVTLCKNYHLEIKDYNIRDFIIEYLFLGYDLDELYKMVSSFQHLMDILVNYNNAVDYICDMISIREYFKENG